jgi:uncharacterized RDD family membrane protein YckC
MQASSEPSGVFGQDGGVQCVNCESETTGSYCSVCGTATVNSQSSPPSRGVLAGWWLRVGATVIDNLILFVPTEIVIRLVGNALNYVVADVAAVLIEGIYMYALLTRPAGQTIGNRAMRTRVRSAADAGPISPDQVLRRYGFVALYSVFVVLGGAAVTMVGLCALVDALAPLFTPTKQTLHDMFARTIVVRQ